MKIGGVCYKRSGTATLIPTTLTPSVSGNFSNCTDCEAPPNVCAGNDCGGSNDPNIQLTISDPGYAGGSITWCGQTWTPAEVLAGATKCACPTTWTTPVPYANQNIWVGATAGLNLYHSTQFGFLALRKVRVFPTNFTGTGDKSACVGSKSNCSATSTGVFAGSPVRGCNPKATPGSGVVNAYIEDCQFFSHVKNLVTYTWQKGINW
jgi:hypothetical protein